MTTQMTEISMENFNKKPPQNVKETDKKHDFYSSDKNKTKFLALSKNEKLVSFERLVKIPILDTTLWRG